MGKHLLARLLAVCLSTAAIAQSFVVQNLSTHPQTAWVFGGLPQHLVPKTQSWASSEDIDLGMRAIPDPDRRGVWLLAELAPEQTVTVHLGPPDRPEDEPCFCPPFEFHRAIVDIGPHRIIPRFWVKRGDGTRSWSVTPDFWPPGGKRPAGAFLRLFSHSHAHQWWHIRTRIPEHAITVDWWARIGSATSTIEWVCHFVYGDVTEGQPISVDLNEVGFDIQVEPHVDFAKRVNIPPAEQSGDRWRQVIMRPAPWGRAARVEARGALLPVDDPGRRQFPICAVSKEWDGGWLAMGHTPERPTNAAHESAKWLAEYRDPPAGNMYDQRRRTQPKHSGTTGEQPDFGFTAGGEAVTMFSPWAVHAMLYEAQSFAMRPTANKEVNGDPVLAVNHPNTKTSGLRPDHRFSKADMLGWPDPVPYSWNGSRYSSPDDQHRADNFKHAAIALTWCPALRSIVFDYIELQKMGYTRFGGVNGYEGAPRGIGRVGLSNANQLWLGFTQARPLLDAAIDYVYDAAAMRDIPEGAPVKTLEGGRAPAKYGWNHANGKPVRGWKPWQESIAAGGFLAIYKVTRSEKALELCLDLSRTVTRFGWYDYPAPDGATMHVYASRYPSDAGPGLPHPPNSYYPSQPNEDNYTTGAGSTWTAAAARILLQHIKPDDPLYARCRELDAWPIDNWTRARWAAVR